MNTRKKIKGVKVGTMLCWLFGHKFVIWSKTDRNGKMREGLLCLLQSDYCVRCGIDKH